MRILGVILARGGSKSDPRNNIRLLAGLPLLGHTLRAATDAGVFERTVVSTEDAETAEIARTLGAEVVDRPKAFAGDGVKSEEVLTHALAEREATDGPYDAVMLLPPTMPFRTASHIREAVGLYATGRFDTVIGIQSLLKYRYEMGADDAVRPCYTRRANRQEREATYIENGAFYLASAALVREGKIFGAPERIGGVIMDKESSVNIDEPVDFDIGEAIAARRARRHVK